MLTSTPSKYSDHKLGTSPYQLGFVNTEVARVRGLSALPRAGARGIREPVDAPIRTDFAHPSTSVAQGFASREPAAVTAALTGARLEVAGAR